MEILFISDYVCPYCLVAKEALKQALDIMGLKPQITWQPHELTPEPAPQVDTYHDQVRKAKYQILVEPCKRLGLDMKLPPNIVPRPRTRLAFEGWYYACDHGMGEEYNEAMYRAYFIDEQDIGSLAVLTDIAGKLGLDPEDFASALTAGTYTAKEQEAITYTRQVLQPKGVPTIYIDGEEIQLSTYTKEEMLGILNDRAFSAGPAVFCGEGGC